MMIRLSLSTASSRFASSVLPFSSPCNFHCTKSISAFNGARLDGRFTACRPAIASFSTNAITPMKMGRSSCTTAATMTRMELLPRPYNRKPYPRINNNIHVRFHGDYDGPGNFDERETGSQLGSKTQKDASPRSHDHSHSHGHEHTDVKQHQPPPAAQPDAITTNLTPDEKQQLRQFLQKRYQTRNGTYAQRAYTIGIGGPVGSGKTALTLALCRALRDRLPGGMGVVTNDIFTQEDADFLVRNEAFGNVALSKQRILAVETGGCPHAAIREDVSANLGALEVLTRRIQRFNEETTTTNGGNTESLSSSSSSLLSRAPLLLCESGGDNLAANFSSELADYTIYVIDVAGGDKVPRKGGPGITQSDLLVINKIDLAEAVGASLDVMDRDSSRMRKRGGGVSIDGGKEEESGPTVFASVKNGVGMEEIIGNILNGFEEAHRLVESSK